MDFVPACIDVQTYQVPLADIIEGLKEQQISYTPRKMPFTEMSEIIENILLKIQLPSGAFKAYGINMECILGNNIVQTLDRFVVKQDIKLEGLCYFPDLNGLYFSELSPRWQRRIKENIWTYNQIHRWTTEESQNDVAQRYRKMKEGL